MQAFLWFVSTSKRTLACLGLWAPNVCILILPGASVLWLAPVRAATPLLQGAPQVHIGEIFTGTQASPNAQYVVLRLQGGWGDNANNTLGYGLVALDASGSKAPVGYLWMDKNVSQTQPGAPVLIATHEASLFFGVAADFVWMGPHLPRQGALCVLRPSGGYDDCVLYGAKQANSLTQLDPRVVNAPLNAAGGIPLGMAAQRLSVSADSSQDFWLRAALWPQNNAGATLQMPAAVCGNGVLEGLEACDAGALCGAAGSRCTSLCRIDPAAVGSVCGNGTLEDGESCDDFNTVDLDGCSSSCQWEFTATSPQPSCGDGRLQLGEACDGGQQNGLGQMPCSATCQLVEGLLLQPSICGNGAVESPLSLPFAPTRAEQCDLGGQNGQPSSSCSSQCRFVATTHALSVCGNGTVEPGEECDDGQLADNDGCSKACKLETTAYFICGNGVLEPQEECDHGSANGSLADSCSAGCMLVPNPLAATASAADAPQSAGSQSALSAAQAGSAAVHGGNCQTVGAMPWPYAALLLIRAPWRRRRRRHAARQPAGSGP